MPGGGGGSPSSSFQVLSGRGVGILQSRMGVPSLGNDRCFWNAPYTPYMFIMSELISNPNPNFIPNLNEDVGELYCANR